MRSLTPDARYQRRTEVIRLRKMGLTYLQIGVQTGLSRTGVFDICKRYTATGNASLRDATAADSPLRLTSAVNGKGQARWKTHVGVLTAGDLIDFLRRLVRISARKVFLVLRGTPALRAPAVQVWLVEHVDEIEVFCRPVEGAQCASARVELATAEPQA